MHTALGMGNKKPYSILILESDWDESPVFGTSHTYVSFAFLFSNLWYVGNCSKTYLLKDKVLSQKGSVRVYNSEIVETK